MRIAVARLLPRPAGPPRTRPSAVDEKLALIHPLPLSVFWPPQSRPGLSFLVRPRPFREYSGTDTNHNHEIYPRRPTFSLHKACLNHTGKSGGIENEAHGDH